MYVCDALSLDALRELPTEYCCNSLSGCHKFSLLFEQKEEEEKERKARLERIRKRREERLVENNAYLLIVV